MADQFLGFTCVVVNGSNLVRAVWEIPIGVRTGVFTAGETLTFPGGGQIVYLSDTGTGGVLYGYLTGTEVEPAVAQTLTGAGGSVPVASVAAKSFPDFAGSPPRFADSPEQGAIVTGNLFYIEGEPHGVVGATVDIKRSSFKLAANWGGSTFNETTVGAYPKGREAAVHRSLTPVKQLPLLAPGEKFPAESFNEAMLRLDTAGGGGGDPPTAWVALTLTSPWALDTGSPIAARRLEPAIDCVRLKGTITPSSDVNDGAFILSGANVLPTGYRPAETLRLEVGGGERVKIASNGEVTYVGPGGRPVLELSGVVFPADGS